jgi:hypothetical protein
MEAGPSSEVRRGAAEIDSDVPDMAGKNTNELALGPAELIVEAAEDAPNGKRLIILHEMVRDSCSGEGGGVINFSEPTAAVSKAFRLN